MTPKVTLKATCGAAELRSAVALAARVAPSKGPRPILRNVRLRVAGDALVVAATDLEVSVRLAVPIRDAAASAAEGVALANARQLLATLRQLPKDGAVELEGSLSGVVLRADGSKFDVLGDAPDDFPELPTLGADVEASASLPAGELSSMVGRVAFAAAREKTRYAMNGVLLETWGDGRASCGRRFRLVATDGKRLTLDERTLAEPGRATFIVAPTLALELARAIGEGSSEPVDIYATASEVFLDFGAALVIARPIEGHFPPYEDVLPKSLGYRLDFERKTFRGALKRASAVCTRDSSAVRFRFNGDLTMTARVPEVGESSATLPVSEPRPDGDVLEVGFNPRFLEEGLKSFSSDRFALELEDACKPAILRDPASPSSFYVVMPINLS